MHKKYIVVGIILVASAATYFSLFSESIDREKIGMSLALTGPNASIGERVKNGSILALEEYNHTHRKVEVVIEDDQSEAKSAVSAFKKLVETNHISTIIGPIRSDQVLAIAPLAEESKIIVLSPTAGADEITAAGDYVFRNIETGESHGRGAALFMQKKGIRSVYVLAGNAANAKTYSMHFKSYATSSNISIVGESSYEAKERDYRTQALKVIQASSDAVYIGVTTAPDAGLLVKQLRTFGFKGIVMMSVAADGKEFFDITQDIAGESYITASPLGQSESGKRFTSAYRKKYGQDADGFAANGYDAMNLILRAQGSCQKEKEDRSCIKTYLYGVKEYDGAGGVITFDINGDVRKEIQIKKAGKGNFELIS